LAIYEFEGTRPKVASSAFVHERASLIGNVSIGEQCFIGAGAIVRGDYGRIEIGNRTSVQDNVVLHARSDELCKIGNDVQLGHGAVLHNCEVKDYAVIGLGSRICDYSIVGSWAIVGEGSVVTARSKIPDGKVAVGSPARVIREVSEEEKKQWSFYKEKYAELCSRYKKGLKRII
jgi:phenylacetic acid degradation protein